MGAAAEHELPSEAMTDGPLPQSCTIQTDDGLALEGELIAPASPVAAAVICHPHPLYGGNMHNGVVDTLFQRWGSAEVATLRFNFRGAGGSDGEHGDGVAERVDIAGAVGELANRFPDVPLILAGYSFGADTALAVSDDRVAAWFLVAPPLRIVPIAEMQAPSDPRQKTIVTGSEDDFRPANQVEEITADWPETTVVVAEGTNHFFTTGLDTVAAAADRALADLIGD